MKTLKALLKYSGKQTTLEFVQGYICGLVFSPQEYNFDKLVKHLFKVLTPEHQIQAQKLVDQTMYKLEVDFEQAQFKLPKKCVLSKKDYLASLQPDSALVQWCNGALLGLTQINKSKLKKEHKQILSVLKDGLITFTSLDNAKQQLAVPEDMFEHFLHERKRNLSIQIHNAHFKLNEFEQDAWFTNNDYFEMDDLVEPFDEETSEIEEMLNIILADESLAVLPILDDMIDEIERLHITKQFIKQNTGLFWLMPETQSYMMLCAHRAYVCAKYKQYDNAIKHMQTLLTLNPNDNQGIRYTLTNLLCITKNWEQQQKLEQAFPDEFLTFTATKALRLFVQQGDSKAAQKVKKQLKSDNKHFMKILTGQEKVSSGSEYFQPGDKSEVTMYIDCFGKQAWLANEGSLFWLRKN